MKNYIEVGTADSVATLRSSADAAVHPGADIRVSNVLLLVRWLSNFNVTWRIKAPNLAWSLVWTYQLILA